jgi:hypothetical protein
MMPEETKQAIEWALTQLDEIHNSDLVDKVREYFNNNEIEYETFSFDDLIPFLPNDGV